MEYKIIQTGSKGNALLLDNMILVDCGVSYKKIKDEHFKIVLLTHEHSDHLNRTTLRMLHENHPAIRFGCPTYLATALVMLCEIKPKQIDVYELGEVYDYGAFQLKTAELVHDVPNVAYEIFFDSGEQVLYATDTTRIDHITAPGFDYYFLEANYSEERLSEIIENKRESGEFCYETRVENTHLSEEQAQQFIMDNASERSRVVFIHRHDG